MPATLATSTEEDLKDLIALDVNIGGKGTKFFFRKNSLGDNLAIKQVFQDVCYRIDHWPQGRALHKFHQEIGGDRPALIIDAGANIGTSAIFFLNIFEGAFVFAIEPEEFNSQLLELNTTSYGQIFNFQGAVASKDGTLCVTDPGKTDMGFRTWEVRPGDDGRPNRRQQVPSLSPASILKHPAVAGMAPLIFKIDIEGAEDDLFSGDTSWMRQFPLIIIELHDWMLPFSGSSKNFLKALANYEFDVVYSGENLFLFNREILENYV